MHHSFISLLVNSFNHPWIHDSLSPSFICSFLYSFFHSFIHDSPIDSFTHPLIDTSENEFRDGNEAANRAKNRYQDILPSDRHRPYLLTTKPDVANNYINAGKNKNDLLTTKPDFANNYINAGKNEIVFLTTKTRLR